MPKFKPYDYCQSSIVIMNYEDQLQPRRRLAVSVAEIIQSTPRYLWLLSNHTYRTQ